MEPSNRDTLRWGAIGLLATAAVYVLLRLAFG